MRKINSILILVVFLIFPLGKISAQTPTHEISVQGGMGLSGLKLSMNHGDSKQKFGGSFGVGYTYFFNENFGLNTGLEVSFLSSEAKFAGMSDRYNTVDSSGDSYQFRSEIGSYKETHNTTYLNVPIMAQYQRPVWNSHQLYCALGFKIGLPVTSKYETNGTSIKTSGYYPQYGMIVDDMAFFGFGNYQSRTVDKTVDLKVAFMLAAEVGMKWELTQSLAVYTGAYLDYGLNDVSKSGKKFMIYDAFEPTHYVNNSILESQYTNNGNTRDIADKVIPLSIGLRVRVAFNAFQ
ncbi:outer membrane beta-barrel protein [Dysgonomonas sp. 25]|uniref:outer membrane beta-barrel protein n=1 Tax=Dysgonomonas sp. 25 TaxID=2302933 RepID=UPI0013D3EB21|nr:outer membrane beta-barrel protein [Dysgonomonas sp. 25]NDV69327.1 PorT family protein [Dysgonomonas sp. 25]